jgi:anti-sigma regulatory factor (Ser/Thr protein kinase)
VNEEIGDISFVFEVIRNNTTVPVILTDMKDQIISYRNIDSVKARNPEFMREELGRMKLQRKPIVIELYNGEKNFIYYKNSLLLTDLRFYPYFQLGVISLFLLVSYLAFSSSRRAEQNRVWIGMAKETAHQLGTPLSSLMAWIELMRLKGVETNYMNEIEKDVDRLQIITQRFSKIGSVPDLKKTELKTALEQAVRYIQVRSSEKVKFKIIHDDESLQVDINVPLFEWVIENLLKNAIDAMNGEGRIALNTGHWKNQVYIDISDTGKGIAKSKFKTVFQPGYTTKSRGWGLGLTLVKRIIEEYHNGQIFVKQSEPGVGTTFRILLQVQ